MTYENIHIQRVNICNMIHVFKLRPPANVTTTSFSGRVCDCCCYADWMSMQYEPSCKHLLCHYMTLHACLLTTKCWHTGEIQHWTQTLECTKQLLSVQFAAQMKLMSLKYTFLGGPQLSHIFCVV